MDHISVNMEDNGVNYELMNCGGLVQEVTEKKNTNILPRDCSCNILEKKVVAFCPHPKSLPETKVKSFGLSPLAEETSKKPTIDSAM